VRRVAVGIDHSLSNSGVAVFTEGEAKPHLTSCIASAPKDPSTEQELHRLQFMLSRIYLAVTNHLEPGDEVLAVFEGPAQGMTSGKPHERGGLFWMVANALHNIPGATVRLTQVPPSTLKKYWAGNGAAKKGEMVRYSRVRYPDLIVKDDNVSDALALGHMGATHLGFPSAPRTPAVDAGQMVVVRWPGETPTTVRTASAARLFEEAEGTPS
jgi:Holliday junction resolvasome RuvABC endonuclease subunit